MLSHKTSRPANNTRHGQIKRDSPSLLSQTFSIFNRYRHDREWPSIRRSSARQRKNRASSSIFHPSVISAHRKKEYNALSILSVKSQVYEGFSILISLTDIKDYNSTSQYSVFFSTLFSFSCCIYIIYV